MFKWDTLKEVGPHDLRSQGSVIRGKACEIELTNGRTIRVWRADDGQQYFCHGLTFGGKQAPGGAISPYTGEPVETILGAYYELIDEAQARQGDILVWEGLAPETTPHSAILTIPRVVPGTAYLDDGTTLRTKNGLWPETDMELWELFRPYGESYNAYRRR